MGCFADYPSDRDLPYNVQVVPYPLMTIDYCVKTCALKGYAIAGLQAG